MASRNSHVYIIESPKNLDLESSAEYRNFIIREFDLVLIENHKPLQLSHVVIAEVPDIEEDHVVK